VSVSSEADYSPGSPMLTWAAKDLAKAGIYYLAMHALALGKMFTASQMPVVQ
jgi:hypothetical protein